jgi:4-carboxymuconolactone decarboxylase
MQPRIDIDADHLSSDQQRVHDAIKAGPRGVVEGPLRVWLHSPALAEHAQRLGAFCRYGSSLPSRLSELAILVSGAKWQAGFEWCAHAPIGVAAGLNPGAVEALRCGQTPEFSRLDEQAIYRFSSELLETRAVTDEVYARAMEQIGEPGMVELVGLLGYYGLIAMTIKAFRVPTQPGQPEPFEAEEVC